jgi:AcrR family transcriptional regulator
VQKAPPKQPACKSGPAFDEVRPAAIRIEEERGKKGTKLTRNERAAILRDNILKSAAQVVGDLGYAEASIAKITEIAGVAHGTFYLYFETRQDLFDQLLPHVGETMLKFLGEQVRGSKNFLEVEERGVRAFFQFLDYNPGFYRLLNEAEFVAPKARRAHFSNLADHYCRSLRRSVANGDLASFDDQELISLAFSLMGARSYIYLSYSSYNRIDGSFEDAVSTYMKIVRHGLN